MKKITKIIIKKFRKSMDNRTLNEENWIRIGIMYGCAFLLIFGAFGVPLLIVEKVGAFIGDEITSFLVIAFIMAMFALKIVNIFEKVSDELDEEERKSVNEY